MQNIPEDTFLEAYQAIAEALDKTYEVTELLAHKIVNIEIMLTELKNDLKTHTESVSKYSRSIIN